MKEHVQQLEIKLAELEKELAIKKRELEIEAGLEKVRSRSLSMHQSSELEQVVVALFDQLVALGLSCDGALIFLFEREKRNIQLWIATKHLSAPAKIDLPYDKEIENNTIIKDYWQAIEKGEHIFNKSYSGETKNNYFRYVAKYNEAKIPESVRRYNLEKDSWTAYFVAEKNSMIGFDSWSGPITFITDEDFRVLLRFASVFEQAYVRFLDLQRAEAQAREAKIEAALERVRARAMAMHKSEELKDVVKELRKQIDLLGQDELNTCVIQLYDESPEYIQSWVSIKQSVNSEEITEFNGIAPKKGLFIIEESLQAYSSGRKDYTLINEKAKLKQWISFLKESFPDAYAAIVESYNGLKPDEVPMYWSYSDFNGGSLLMVMLAPPADVSRILLRRFANVFGLAYRRFVDLKQAEAQAREAQIQLALERVRARTMAMQKSEELTEASKLLFQQLQTLGMPAWSAGYCIFHEDKQSVTIWMSSDGVLQPPFRVPLTEEASFIRMREAYERGETFYVEEVGGEELRTRYQYLRTLSVVGEMLDSIIEEGHPLPTFQIFHFVYFSHGYLLFITYEPVPEAYDIFKRFGKVFDQTYTRFLDLQKAEAQAREAQIEAALEKVRSRSLSMHNSDELLEVVTLVRDKLIELDIVTDGGVTIFSFGQNSRDADHWISNPSRMSSSMRIHFPYFDHPLYAALFTAKENGVDFYSRVSAFEEKNTFWTHVFDHSEFKLFPDELKKWILESQSFTYSIAFAKKSAICINSFSGEILSENQIELIKRFARVFEQAYIRFLDLQKAEAQAREAQIEASLERVRAKAMAMHSSEDLVATISAFYNELELLGVKPRRCGVGLLSKESFIAEMFMSIVDDGYSKEVIVKINLTNYAVLRNIYEHWLEQQEYHLVLRDNDLKEYLQIVRPQLSLPDYPEDIVQYGYFFYFTEGGFLAWTEKEMTEDDLKIYRRFTSVLSLTYKRYKDLKDAEARALIAIREASLNRIRAEIAAMRTANDLQRITPSVWRELIVLGIPFFRCGVFIINEREQLVHIYLSTPDGKPLAALHLDINNSDTTRNVAEYWRMQQVYCTHWDREQFTAWVQSLIGQRQITEATTYQAGDEPPESLTLQFVPFVQGMLYVGSAQPLTDTQIELVQALAEALAVAYARYEDFSNLEAALSELRSTQSQLIQKEKMASLGELTAGIAHEIQNPLNFVNNFSEINAELIEELRGEWSMVNGENNKQVAESLLNDIEQNTEKIIHHGKRADSIVKGMLQHSRASTGKKELTDINALVDECVRLSYHGMRAKDKEFNAAIKTELDGSIGKVNIVPQDISRVLLNLLNNAFYTVDEKKAQLNGTYEPTVSVCTKKLDGKVEIQVKDNGNGIPQNIINKIFQPFFTTKPTGQGTGLGLSLSYDIIKAHGGEIRVESKESEGTEFRVVLFLT